MSRADAFREARDGLLALRTDYDAARASFAWPAPARFNWALDWFDALAGGPASGREALRVVGEERVRSVTFGALSERSSSVANWLRDNGIRRGDRVVLMLGNAVELWEAMLGCMKVGAVMVPTSTLVTTNDIGDRLARADAKGAIVAGDLTERFDPAMLSGRLCVAVGPCPTGWRSFAEIDMASSTFAPDGPTAADDPLFLYFTSGTTAKPKLVEHTHASYPIGHLSTMFWLGLQPGAVHLNISSPGWAKHAWSCMFAPWNAEATVVALDQQRFDADRLLNVLVEHKVTSLCAPPTVWRMLVQCDLHQFSVGLTEAISAGEPLNPEIIATVTEAWGLTIRDGFGQTETTALVGNSPGQPVKPGSMGRPLPGYDVVVVDDAGKQVEEGEVAVRLDPRPVGVMAGYRGDPERTAAVTAQELYRTGDIASRDADGYLTYVGRADDVFKSSDYRISPFELESALVEHPAVAEAAVVPSPDARRLAVPKAFVVLVAGTEPSRAVAEDVFAFTRTRLNPFARIRRIEFSDLPKTVSGKIRRAELRTAEAERRAVGDDRRTHEFWEEDLGSDAVPAG